ncbi:MAG: hypothetical protein RIT36_1312, partial [Bacteroidota bacterium]
MGPFFFLKNRNYSGVRWFTLVEALRIWFSISVSA